MAKKRAYAEWGRQPIGPVGIEHDHARAEGLVFFAPMSGAHGTRDLVGSQLGVRTGLEAYLPAQNGAIHHLFGSSQYADFPEVPSAIGATTPFTVAWTQEARSTTGSSTVLDVNFGTAGAHGSFLIYQSGSSATYYFTAGPRLSTAQSWSVARGALTDNVQDRFVLLCSGGSQSLTGADYVLYCNGALVAQGTATAFGNSTTAGFRVGALLSSASDPFEGLIGDLRIWSRVLPVGDAEDESTVQGSWKLYAKSRILVPVSAGGSSVSLTVADATHGHTADGLVLTSSTALSVAEATHAHAADAITLVVGSGLTVAEASHAHTADNPTLTAASALAVSDATHSHAADNITLSVAGATNLTVADALHSHAADALALTSAHALIVADATHGHAVDGLTLTAASVLAIQEALHAHAADNVTLDASGAVNLLLADSLHAHTADGLTLTVAAWLTVADALHGHATDNVVLTFAGPTVLSAPPLGHGPATARRINSAGRSRAAQLSTRTR